VENSRLFSEEFLAFWCGDFIFKLPLNKCRERCP